MKEKKHAERERMKNVATDSLYIQAHPSEQKD